MNAYNTEFNNGFTRRITEARDKALAFVERADDVLNYNQRAYFYPSKKHAAMRRASLELTNALVGVRLPKEAD